MSDGAGQLPVTSSEEPIWAPDARQCYQGVVRGLLQSGIPFAVSGGFAFHQHTGIWRTTKDLDLVLPPDAVPGAFEILVEEGSRPTSRILSGSQKRVVATTSSTSSPEWATPR